MTPHQKHRAAIGAMNAAADTAYNGGPLTVSYPVRQIAHNLLLKHTGSEGGCPTIDWYKLRAEISDAIAVALDEQRRRDTPTATEIQAAPEPIKVTNELVHYISRYGGRCRDCADEDGVCPTSGLPCEGAAKAIHHVLNALNYGVSNGFLPASPISSPPDGKLVRMREALEAILLCHKEGGLLDSVDNDGEHYTSQALIDAIAKARAALSAKGAV
jgi:hypothetical protein